MLPTRALLPFSPDYAFVAARPVTVGGQAYAPGDAIPKGALSDRRLRQLYEQRKIAPHAPDFLFNGLAAGAALKASGEGQDGHEEGDGGEPAPTDEPSPNGPPRTRRRAKADDQP